VRLPNPPYNTLTQKPLIGADRSTRGHNLNTTSYRKTNAQNCKALRGGNPEKERSLADTVAVLSCIFIVFLCVISYFPLKDRMAQDDFQSLSYGPALSAMLPLMLTAFGMLFSLVTIYVSTKTFGGVQK
jgi:hypothetical protein